MEQRSLKYSLCSRFNLSSAIGNRNNCILATGDFSRERFHMLRHASSFCKWCSLKMFSFQRPHCLDDEVLDSIVFSLFFTALWRDNLCALPGSFICWYLVEASGGHQMKNINHTGELLGDLRERERSKKRINQMKCSSTL